MKSRKAATKSKHREIWSLFTGAMGLDLGLEAAGLKPTLAAEIDPVFCRTIRANRPELTLIEGDVRELSADDLRRARSFDGEVHLMVGGPPCQSFSSGGKRAALNDPRGNLVYEYLRLVGEVRPRYFILENVANLATAAIKHRPIAERPGKHWSLKRYETASFLDDGILPMQPDELAGSALKAIVADVGRLGYNITFGVVDAADYGAPQHRLRFVLLGSRDEPPPTIPDPSHGPGRQAFMTVRDAIAGLADEPGPHSSYTDAVRRFFELVPEGGNWRSLPKELHEAALGGAYASGGGKTGFYRRLSWDNPSPTITGRANRKASALCHPSQVRPLGVRECAALQGFPVDWEIVGSMNAAYTQVGNAVPVALGKALGLSVIEHEASLSRPAPVWRPDFDEMTTAAITRLRSAGRNKRSVAKAA